MSLQQGSLSVSAYNTKFKSLWESLAQHKIAHSYTCGGIAPWPNYTHMEYVMHFLMGPNDSFSSFRGQILTMDPIPPITKVFSLCVQDKKQREVGSSVSNNEIAHAFAFKNNSHNASRGPKNDRHLCAHCGMLGLTKEKCYMLHGYPPIYKKKKKRQTISIGHGKSSCM